MALSRSVTEAVGGMMDSLGMGKKKASSGTQTFTKTKPDTTKYTKPSTMGDVLTTALGKTDVMSNQEKAAYKKAVE